MTQEKAQIEKLDGKTMDVVEHNIEQLKELFPEVFAEGKISFDKLQELLGNYVVEDEDHYNFTWHGKRAAGRLAQTPSTGTLRPVKDESVDWDTTQNLFIEGDNLEVLKLLQKSYHRQVKMIYIDPPYNTGNDFVYEDDFKDGVKNYLETTGQLDSESKKKGTNSSSAGRYHTNWLNMMYPRLKLARNLLRDDGVIFISIDDREQSNIRKLCDEIFGEENFINNVIWQKKYTRSNDARWFSDNHDFILVYAKSKLDLTLNKLPRNEEQLAAYKNPDQHPKGRWKATPLHAKSGSNTSSYTFLNGTIWAPPKGTYRRYNEETMGRMDQDNEIWFGANGEQEPNRKSFLSEVQDGVIPVTIWPYNEVGHNHEANNDVKSLGLGGLFDNPKPVRLIENIITLSCNKDENEIVMDFFAGSATTAQATYQKNFGTSNNLRFINVQLPEETNEKSEAFKSGYKNISDISKERIRRAAKKIKEENPDYDGDLGFKVFKLDSSNIKHWEAGFETLEQDLLGAVDYIKNERSSEDVLYELLLKYGLDLTVPIETRTISDNGAGKTIYSIGLGALVVCLEKDVSMDMVNGIGALKEELNPEIMRVVFKDEGFKDDVVKTNALQTLKRFGIEDIKSL